MINYPEDFKKECKAVYPKWFCLHEALESGSQLVGDYLKEACNENLDIDDVLNTSDVLREKAKEIKIKRELFYKWLKLPINAVKDNIS